MRRTLLASLALALATLATYARVLGHEFVDYDDPAYVSENGIVRQGITWVGVQWAFTTGHAGNWHPLTWLSLMLDCELFGASRAWPHLAVNALLHAASAVLLFTFLRTTTGAFWRALAVAGVFALHPLRVESVAWVSERKDVLATLLWIAAMHAHARHARAPSVSRYALVALALALGLAAKPMAVTLPFALLLLDVWPLRRWTSLRPPRALLVEKLPLLALVAASIAVTLVVQSRGGAVGDATMVPIDTRVLNAFVSYATYVGQTLWPFGLTCFYPHPIDDPDANLALTGALAAVLLAAITFAVARRAREAPYALVGWLWFLGTAVPVIGLVQVGAQAHADRYTYVPSIGLYVMVAWSLGTWGRSAARAVERRRHALRGATLLVLALCAAVSVRQVGFWRDARSLWEHALAVTPDNAFAHNSLGTLAFAAIDAAPPDRRRALLDEAAAHFERATQLAPQNAEAQVNLALVEYQLGERERAVERLLEAARKRPLLTRAEYNLGVAMAEAGDMKGAERWFGAATESRGDQGIRVEAWTSLGLIAYEAGRLDEARERFAHAVRLDPSAAPAQNGLGAVLLAAGDRAGAIAAFRAAVAAGSAEAAQNLAQMGAR